LVARHPGEIIAAVSHADPIKAAVAQALGTPLDSVPAHLHRSRVDHRRRLSSRRPAVLTVNSMDGDLAALAPE
jgi:probable phosphoglycerate mutase